MTVTSDVDGEVYNATATFTSGAATITIAADEVITAGDQTLTVNVAGVTTDDTVDVTVDPATAAALSVSQQPEGPSSSGAQLATQPVVQVEDQYGNVLTGDSATTVTASKDAGDAGDWTLGGTTTVTVVNGVATFTDLTGTDGGDTTADTDATLQFDTDAGAFDVDSNDFIVPGN